VLKNKNNFNYYITTDLTVSGKKSADFAAIFVWAISANSDRLLVDMVLKKQALKQSRDDLFRLAQKWGSINGWIDVGIELDGQQEGFLLGFDEHMLATNIFFNIANQKGTNKRGIRSSSMGSKHNRAIMMVPQFKLHKYWFPTDWKRTPEMIEILNELTNISAVACQSAHDDAIDACSQLEMMTLVAPTGEGIKPSEDDARDDREARFYWEDEFEEESSGNSYT
jgi:phage terminase large subunit-like protein